MKVFLRIVSNVEKKSASGVNDLYNQMKEDIKKPLHIWSEKLKSPFWLTYILWWVVFNYDFLLILFGFQQKLIDIKTYYHYPKCGESFCPSFLYYFLQNNWASGLSFLLYDIVLPFSLTALMLWLVYPHMIHKLEEVYYGNLDRTLKKRKDIQEFHKKLEQDQKILEQKYYELEQQLIDEQNKRAILEEQYKNASGIEDDIPF